MQFSLFDEIQEVIRDATPLKAFAFLFAIAAFTVLVHFWVYFAYAKMHV